MSTYSDDCCLGWITTWHVHSDEWVYRNVKTRYMCNNCSITVYGMYSAEPTNQGRWLSESDCLAALPGYVRTWTDILNGSSMVQTCEFQGEKRSCYNVVVSDRNNAAFCQSQGECQASSSGSASIPDTIIVNRWYNLNVYGNFNSVTITGGSNIGFSGNSFYVKSTGSVRVDFDYTLQGCYTSSGSCSSNAVYENSWSWSGVNNCSIGDVVSINGICTTGICTISVVGDTVEVVSNSNGTLRVRGVKEGVSKIQFSCPSVGTYIGTSGNINFTVKKKLQNIIYDGPTDLIVGSLVTFTVTSDSGLSDFICEGSDGLVILGNSIISERFGIFSLTIVQEGNEIYESSTLVVTIVSGIDNLSPVLLSSGGFPNKEMS